MRVCRPGMLSLLLSQWVGRLDSACRDFCLQRGHIILPNELQATAFSRVTLGIFRLPAAMAQLCSPTGASFSSPDPSLSMSQTSHLRIWALLFIENWQDCSPLLFPPSVVLSTVVLSFLVQSLACVFAGFFSPMFFSLSSFYFTIPCLVKALSPEKHPLFFPPWINSPRFPPPVGHFSGF